MRAAIERYDKMASYAVEAIKVESGVSDQPLSLNETTLGAETRSRHARDTAGIEAKILST